MTSFSSRRQTSSVSPVAHTPGRSGDFAVVWGVGIVDQLVPGAFQSFLDVFRQHDSISPFPEERPRQNGLG